jgi:hypothetical protein
MTSVYLAYSAADQLLYVGISLRPRIRLMEHTQQSEWWPQVQRIEVEHYNARPLARARELHLIQTASPLFNREGRSMPEFELNDISELRHERDRFEALLTEAIRRARAKDDSWEKIAQRLGVSRQAAQQRYGPKVEE